MMFGRKKKNSPEKYKPEIVTIGGIRFMKTNGLLKLIDNVQVTPLEPNTMIVFEKHGQHRGFSRSCVLGEWCINGCQTFHKDDAEEVFNSHDVPDEYRLDIMNAFSEYTKTEFILSESENYQELQILNGTIHPNCNDKAWISHAHYKHFEHQYKTNKEKALEYLRELHDVNENLFQKVLNYQFGVQYDEFDDITESDIQFIKDVMTFGTLPIGLHVFMLDGKDRMDFLSVQENQKLSTGSIGNYINDYNSANGELDIDFFKNFNYQVLKYIWNADEKHHDVLLKVLPEMQFEILSYEFQCYSMYPEFAKQFASSNITYSTDHFLSFIASKPCKEICEMVLSSIGDEYPKQKTILADYIRRG